MATLTATNLARTGIDISGTSADVAGDEWTNTGQEFVVVHNGGGSSITVTLDIEGTMDGAAVTDPTVSISAGATKVIGPFPVGFYNNSSTGRASISYSAVTSVTVKVIKFQVA